MAVAPLFERDIATLKSKLRLTGAVQSDSLAIIDKAIQNVRIQFYNRLGASRVEQLLALPVSDSPTDRDSILRLTATNTEISWVRMFLLRELPTMFADASGASKQTWNEEGFTREGPIGGFNSEIKRLQEEIDENLIALAGDNPDIEEIKVSSIGPCRRNKFPGHKILKETLDET